MLARNKSQALEFASQTNQTHESILAIYLTDHFLRDDFQVFCPPIIYLASVFSGLLVSVDALKIIQYFTQGALKGQDFT